jgi:glycosyltransferase involved in cell wall biosynthesis
MKRIAYLMGTFPALTETFVLGEIRALLRAGLSVELFALRRPRTADDQSHGADLAARTHYGGAPWGREIRAANLRVLRRSPRRYLATLGAIVARTALNPVHCLKSIALFPTAAAFADLMADRRVDHLHAHWASYPATAAYIVARLLGISYSITAHVYDATLVRSLMREKLRRARFVVTCNRWSADRLARLVPEAADRIALNYHGVDLDRFPAIDGLPEPASEPPTILSCGSLYPRKGFMVLLEACRILRDRGWKFRTSIIGEGPVRGQLERFIRTHHLDDVVALEGARPHRQVLQAYRSADVFALACMTDHLGWHEIFSDPLLLLEVGPAIPFRPITDGIPNVLVEAMAVGLPVVSTTVAGVPELVEHERTGLLVPERDPGALASAMERLLQDAELRRRLGARARAVVHEQFDRARNIQDLVRILGADTAGHRLAAREVVPCARS